MPIHEGNTGKTATETKCPGDGSCDSCQEEEKEYKFDSQKDIPAWERYAVGIDDSDVFVKSPITGGHPMFHKLLETMRKIHNAKNADYGDGKQLGNFMEAEDFGVEAWRGALVRLSDKYSRIKSLSKRLDQKGEVDSESFSDTLLDMANYSLLVLILYEESKKEK